jgi:hypothetical protein
MGKKTVLLGFVGLYRTFKITSENLFANLITPNSHDYDFTIIINTDKQNNDRVIKRGGGWKSSEHYQYDDNNLLDKDLNRYYNRKKQLKDIIYYNNNSNTIGGTGIFELRIKQILEKEKKKYDFYIFLRMDVVLNKSINLNNFQLRNGFINGSQITRGLLHDRDFDYCWFGTNEGIHLMVFPEKSKYWKNITNNDLTNELLYNINDQVGFKGKFIKYLQKNKDTWAIRWYKRIHNLHLNNCVFNVFHEKRNIYAKIIR